MTKSTFVTAIRCVAALVAACSLGASAFAGITVTKDVNSGKPPKDLMIVFDKTAKDAKSFKPSDRNGHVSFAFADDGALLVKVNKIGASEIVFPFPETMDIGKARYILLTCKLEGQTRRMWDGKWGQWTPYTGAKIWWGAFVLDTAGTRSAGYVNFDAVSPDGWLPTEMKTIRIPAVFFTKRGEGWGDPLQTAAFMITTTQVRETDERDLTLTIDRLVIAE